MTDVTSTDQRPTPTLQRPAAWKRWLKSLVFIYAGYLALMYFAQRSILFPGQYREAPATIRLTEGIEQVWIEHDGTKVEVLLLAPLTNNADKDAATATTNQKHPAIIYTHGNGELIDDWLTTLRPYREVGCYVVLVEFPGYGRSTGSPSEASIAAVLTRTYDELLKRFDIDPAKIVAHGRSMGGGAACLLADARPVAALILESTFTSISAMAVRYCLPGFLCSDPLDNESVVTNWKKPLLILHGTRDRVVPYSHGEALAKANPAATFITWQDVDHNDYPPPISRSWSEVRGFLEKAGVLEK